MIIRGIKIFTVLLFFASCDSGSPFQDVPIPPATFSEIVIDLAFPEYLALGQDGGNVQVTANNAGVRGIILHRTNANTFIAFEKNCSFQPNDVCATVEVHTSGLFMIDPCCGSTFTFSDGAPTGGPASLPLRIYRTQKNGSVITITDEVVN